MTGSLVSHPDQPSGASLPPFLLSGTFIRHAVAIIHIAHTGYTHVLDLAHTTGIIIHLAHTVGIIIHLAHTVGIIIHLKHTVGIGKYRLWRLLTVKTVLHSVRCIDKIQLGENVLSFDENF